MRIVIANESNFPHTHPFMAAQWYYAAHLKLTLWLTLGKGTCTSFTECITPTPKGGWPRCSRDSTGPGWLGKDPVARH